MNDAIGRVFGFAARHALGLSLVLLILVFGTLEGSFLTPANITSLIDQSAIFAVLAVGATFGIISRNIDIAPASVIALADVVAALTLKGGFGFLAGLAAAAITTVAIYAGHGALIAWFELDPLIVTLAAWIWARGLAVSFTNASTIPFHSDFVTVMNAPMLLNLTPAVVVAVAVFGIGHMVLRHTPLGLHTYALGQDARLLRQAGVNPARAKLAIFLFMGVTTAVGAILMLARIGAAAPTAGFGLELDAIVAVIIGGTSFKGGSGRIANSLFGVAFIAVLNNGLSGLQMGDPEFLLLKGLAILAALLLDATGRRLADRKTAIE